MLHSPRVGEDWYYLQGAGPSRWLKVVVAFDENNDGSVLTAFPEETQAMSIQIGPYTFDRVRYDHDAGCALSLDRRPRASGRLG